MTNDTISLADLARNWSDDCNTMTPAETIREALGCGYRIGKYADPVEGERIGLDEDEAIDIAGIDSSLLYCVL